MVLSPVGPVADAPRAHVLVETPRSEWFSYGATALSGARSAADVAALEEALTKALWLLAK